MEAKHRLFKDNLPNTVLIYNFTTKLSYFQYTILGFGEFLIICTSLFIHFHMILRFTEG